MAGLGLNDDFFREVRTMQSRTLRFVVFWSIVNLVMICAGLGLATAAVVGVLKLFGVI